MVHPNIKMKGIVYPNIKIVIILNLLKNVSNQTVDGPINFHSIFFFPYSVGSINSSVTHIL